MSRHLQALPNPSHETRGSSYSRFKQPVELEAVAVVFEEIPVSLSFLGYLVMSCAAWRHAWDEVAWKRWNLDDAARRSADRHETLSLLERSVQTGCDRCIGSFRAGWHAMALGTIAMHRTTRSLELEPHERFLAE
jgi:hypothetical protein